MFYIFKRSRMTIIFTTVTVAILVSFQNCAKTTFSDDLQSASASASTSEQQRSTGEYLESTSDMDQLSPDARVVASSICEGRTVRVIDVETDSVFSKKASNYGSIQIAPGEMVFYRVKTPAVKNNKVGMQWGLSTAGFSSKTEVENFDLSNSVINGPDYSVSVSPIFCDFSKALPKRSIGGDERAWFQTESGILIRQQPSREDRNYTQAIAADTFYYIQIKTIDANKALYLTFYSHLYGLLETPIHPL